MSELDSTDNSQQLVGFDSREQAAELCLQLIEQARREICFFGPSLDPVLFDNNAVVKSISEFARRSQRSTARFVVHSTLRNVSNHHRLLPLAERLSSHLHIHTASEQDKTLLPMFLLVDSSGYLYCHNSERYQGNVSFADPARVRELKQQFEEIWTHSVVDINSRRLHI